MLAGAAPTSVYPDPPGSRRHRRGEGRCSRPTPARSSRGFRIERTMAFAFDTLVQAKRLREAGFDEKQAEALTAVLRDAVKPFDTSELATKSDLADLKADVKADLAALKADVATKSELAALKADVKADLAALKADLLQWVIGLVLGAVVLNAFVVIGSIFGLLKLLGR
jgi:hypothetical protein